MLTVSQKYIVGSFSIKESTARYYFVKDVASIKIAARHPKIVRRVLISSY